MYIPKMELPRECAVYEFIDEPMISLSEYFGDRITVSPQYFLEGGIGCGQQLPAEKIRSDSPRRCA